MRATPWIAAAAMTFLASGHARADEFWSSYENALTSFLAGEPSPGDFYAKAAPKFSAELMENGSSFRCWRLQ